MIRTIFKLKKDTTKRKVLDITKPAYPTRKPNTTNAAQRSLHGAQTERSLDNSKTKRNEDATTLPTRNGLQTQPTRPETKRSLHDPKK